MQFWCRPRLWGWGLYGDAGAHLVFLRDDWPMTTLRVALIGYGNAGRIFHAPLIGGVPGLELAVAGYLTKSI